MEHAQSIKPKSIVSIAHRMRLEYEKMLPTFPLPVSYEEFESRILSKAWTNAVLRNNFISKGMIECMTYSGTITAPGQQTTSSFAPFPFAPSFTQNVSTPQGMPPPPVVIPQPHVQNQNIPPPVAQGSAKAQGLQRAPTNAILETHKQRAMEFGRMGYNQKNYQLYNGVVAAPAMQPPSPSQGNSSAGTPAQPPRSAQVSPTPPPPYVQHPGPPQQQSWPPMAQPYPQFVQGSQSSMPAASHQAVQQQGVQPHRPRLASKPRARKQSGKGKRKADALDGTDDLGGANGPDGPALKQAKPTPSTSAQAGQDRFSARSSTTPGFTAPPAQGAQAPPVAPQASVPAPNPPGPIYNFNVFGQHNGSVNVNTSFESFFPSVANPAAASVHLGPVYENGPSFNFASPGASGASTRQQPQGPPAMQNAGGSSQSASRPTATPAHPGPIYAASDPSFDFLSPGTSRAPTREQPQRLPANPTGHSSSTAEPSQTVPAVLNSVVDGPKIDETDELEYVDDGDVFGDESKATAGGDVAPPCN